MENISIYKAVFALELLKDSNDYGLSLFGDVSFLESVHMQVHHKREFSALQPVLQPINISS